MKVGYWNLKSFKVSLYMHVSVTIRQFEVGLIYELTQGTRRIGTWTRVLKQVKAIKYTQFTTS